MKHIVEDQVAQSVATLQAVLADETLQLADGDLNAL